MSANRCTRTGPAVLVAACASLCLLSGIALAQPAAALIPEGAQVTTVSTIARLLAVKNPADGAYFRVEGYHAPGDDGGGVFRFAAGSDEEPDGGTVLKPNAGAGRFLRVFDPYADVYAEWFGAYGDGDAPDAHDDQAAINACLQRFNRVRLLAKTYGVRGKPAHYDPNISYHSIDLGPWYRVEGSGRDRTRIRLLEGTNPAGNRRGDSYFVLIANRKFHESADYCTVRDLTVDCNFDAQDKHSTIHAIHIRGGGALVERVNLRGYGTGWDPSSGSSRECFVVSQTLVYKHEACRMAAVLRDLDFTDAGHNGDVAGHVAEITHIGIGGANNFDDLSWITPKGKDPDFDPSDGGENEKNWWPSYGGLVENCHIHDVQYDPETQKSPLNGITYGDCVGLTIRGNRVSNFDGAGVFVMSWWDRYTTITDNLFENVAYGVSLQIKGDKDLPVQHPRREHTLVERNRIILGTPRKNQWGAAGIHLYGQSLGEGIRMRDMIIRGNHITGRAFENARGEMSYPIGISFQVLHANYANIVIEDNVIDVPDFPTDSVTIPKEAGSLSMRFYPLARWEADNTSRNVVYRNNRDPNGRLLAPSLVDWYYKNPAEYGKPAVD